MIFPEVCRISSRLYIFYTIQVFSIKFLKLNKNFVYSCHCSSVTTLCVCFLDVPDFFLLCCVVIVFLSMYGATHPTTLLLHTFYACFLRERMLLISFSSFHMHFYAFIVTESVCVWVCNLKMQHSFGFLVLLSL